MKTVIMFSCLIAASAVWASTSVEVPVTEVGGYRPSGDRDVKWAQYPHHGVAFSSHYDTLVEMGSESADDFLCEDPEPIVAIEWWGVMAGPEDPPGQYFMIRFYSDVPGPPFSHPGVLLYEEPCHAFQVESVPDPDWGHILHYTQILTTPFLQEPASIYWVSIQNVVDVACHWYWLSCDPAYWWNDCCVQRGPWLDPPEWTPSTDPDVWGEHEELAFVLHDTPLTSVDETTWGAIKAMYR